jgi:DNA-binding transcriptional regulator YiaG
MERFFELKSEALMEMSKEMTCSRLKSIRRSYRLSQVDFAQLLNISYHTYKNWEIGHRQPSTSAVALLTLAQNQPQVFLKKTEEIFKMKFKVKS